MSRIVLAVALALALSATARAAPDLEAGIEDERLLLDTPGRAAALTQHWARIGFVAVRIHARWRDRHALGGLDAAVDAATNAGLEVQLTITGKPVRPDPRRYARFAARVARRYRGRIARYLIWNEPNVPGWLRPTSPHLYRAIVRAAVPAVHRADPGAPVLIGELASIGTGRRAPLAFLRAFGCVDAAYRPVTTGRCRHFRPASADGFGHHPHAKQASPTTPSPDPDWAKIGDLGRLERVLDRLTVAHRILAPGDHFDLWLTEFGYETAPPDPGGISLARQARWLQIAAYRAWRDPRVRSLSLYEWADEPTYRRNPGGSPFAGWQSGLRLVDGTPKPALHGVRVPFVIDRDRGRVWGQARVGGAHTVGLQRRAGSGWVAVGGPIRTDARGAFLQSLPLRTGERLRYVTETGRSGAVAVPAAGLAAPSR